MAPDLALDVLGALPDASVVLDPMCGSGTVVRCAADIGHQAVGCDVDPLAVLMARVWTTSVDADEVATAAEVVVRRAEARGAEEIHLPWIDNDAETRRFVDYWFAEPQAGNLRRLVAEIGARGGALQNLLKLALSKIIVTKDRGASLGRDVSHSRPHRVADSTDFDVYRGYILAVRRILAALAKTPPRRPARVLKQDGRSLPSVRSDSVDCVLTSPPYLNAIDYIRGHRLALVWLGHRVTELRAIRSDSIGAERRYGGIAGVVADAREQLTWISDLPSRDQGILDRYIYDSSRLAKQVRRVLKPRGSAVLVVGNSTLRGTFVRNSEVIQHAFERLGLRLVKERSRAIPPNRRYLPPPSTKDNSSMAKRMRTEVVQTYATV